ncbi:MAG: hypothetical protein UY56_C0019G0005 [Parcubacteria group bacterium GW2011_GWA1_50_14]|nr:MAG: hypothetical protein UY56_C0019G0005 [Parcubacteria group bacterium GW2011_GWA1_50_14]
MRKRKCAVFDIDGTIFRSSLLIESVEALIDSGAFPKRAREIFEGPHRRWLDRKDGYDKYIGAVIAASDKYTKGMRRGDYLRIIRGVVRRHKDRVYRYTRDLIRDLKRKNYYLLSITHSPKYIADGFAKTLKFDKVYGRLFEIDARGRFTGGVLHEDLIVDKAKILLRAVGKENLTLRGSVGVGDSESDIPFLTLVSRPICFNPNLKLYRVAKRMGWEVVVERKDVIYQLNLK